jgi:hypothetical protein
MRGFSKATLVLLLSFPVLAAEPPADAGASIDKLTASVDRLARLLERDAPSRAEEREARRVEVAVGVLGVRYRKIDRLEDEIQRNAREEEELGQAIEMARAQRDEFAKQARGDGGEANPTLRNDLAMFDMHVKRSEDRAAKLRDRNNALQGEVASEKQRVASIEALIDDWLGKQ